MALLSISVSPTSISISVKRGTTIRWGDFAMACEFDQEGGIGQQKLFVEKTISCIIIKGTLFLKGLYS